MKIKLITTFILALGIQTVNAQVPTKPFVHPGMMQNRAQLETMKKAVLSGQQPWKAAFDRLKSTTPANYITQPVTHLSQGAYGAGDRGGRELLKAAQIAYDAALLWYITGDKGYANESMNILNAWSAQLWDLDGNNAKLLTGLSGHYLLNAAEILKYSNSGWREADINQFKNFMLTVYNPLIKDFFPEANGNWDGSMINTMLGIGIFCDDHAIFNRAVERYQRGIGNGGITKYIYPGGQIQESTRDWGHVQLGLGEFAKAAQTAWTQGVDLYRIADNRLAQGFEYASKYMLGEDVPVYGVISPRERGKSRDIYENIYNHYHFRQHLEMPYTLGMVKHTRPESSEVLLVSLAEPLNEPANVTKMPEPGTKAIRAGAPDVVADAGSDAIKVAPGNAIQPALDRCPKGGRVVLLKGIHTIKASLRIPSDITLSGEGKQTILFLSPEAKVAPAIVNASPTMQNVTLTDFLIEGALKTTENNDPNGDRRTRASQLAATRAGIVFYGQSDSLMKNINLTRVTVQNCTQNGVAIAGATGVTIAECNFSDNGSSVPPGNGQLHNLHLTHIRNAQIKNCRLDTSPWGCGLDITSGTNIVITGNEAARNKIDGIRCNDVRNVTISQNLTEGNDSSGISVNTLFNGSTGQVTGNLSQNNGGKGVTAIANIKLLNNKQVNNGIR